MAILSDQTNLDWRESATLSAASLSVAKLVQELGIPVIVAEMLARRGFEDLDAVKTFLNPSKSMLDGWDPLPGIQKAAEALLMAKESGDKVFIWGDFDADGQTSTSLLHDAFVELGINSDWYVPSRFGEGHGLNTSGLDQIASQGAKIVITCDCGSVNEAEVEYGRTELNLEFIITDHHEMGNADPKALAHVNPQLVGPEHPSHTLCGVGVAYKLVALLFELEGRPEPTEYLDLVALGTIADVAALTGENRILVIDGLNQMKSNPRPGIKALMDLARVQNSPVPDTEGVGFFIAPRLNAVGRLEHAKRGVNLLISKTSREAASQIAEFEVLNQRRRSISDDLLVEVEEQISKLGDIDSRRSFVLAGEGWHAGVTGIVAGRIAERYQRPTALVSIDEENVGHASARSVEDVHLEKAIMANKPMLIGGGGHAQAAGFQIKRENIESFREAFENEVQGQLGGKIPKPFLLIEDWIDIGDITPQWLTDIYSLAPFGQANPYPVWGAKGVKLVDPLPFGKENNHTKFQIVNKDGDSMGGIWWRTTISEVPDYDIDVAFKVEPDLFRGGMTPRLVVKALRASDSLKEIPVEEFQPDFHDYRDLENRQEILSQLREKLGDNYEIWAEGDDTVEEGKTRAELEGKDNLIIWTAPPSSDQARRVIRQFRPPQIFVLTQSAKSTWGVRDVLVMFRTVILKNISKQGEIKIEEIARKSGLETELVKSLMVDFRESGQINWREEKGRVFLSRTDEARETGAAGVVISDRSNFLIQEIASYKRLFKQINLSKLL